MIDAKTDACPEEGLQPFPFAIRTRRPGDFYAQAAAICSLLEQGHFGGPEKVLILSDVESQFLDLRDLFAPVPTLQFDILSDKSLRGARKKYNLLWGIHRSALFNEGQSRFHYRRLCHLVSEMMAKEADPFPADGFIRLLVTLDIEKRRWLGQESILSHFIDTIQNDTGQPVLLVNNGMTRSQFSLDMDGFATQRGEEAAVLERIAERTGCYIFDMFNFTSYEKLVRIKYCDIAVSPLGTGVILPMFLGIPIAAVGNAYLHDWRGAAGLRDVSKLHVYPRNRTRDLIDSDRVAPIKVKSPGQLYSYEVEPNDFAAFLDTVWSGVRKGPTRG